MAGDELKEEKKLYKKFLDDEYHHIENLEIELKKPNIFNILGISRMEIRHSNFLGWLLDPNESHGLGNKFLVRILRDLALDEKNTLDIIKVSKLNFNNIDVRREYPISSKNNNDKDKKIDILIIFRDDNLVICIENKIDSKDSKQQLKDYRDYINETFKKEDDKDDVEYKNIFVYLTPNGDDPTNDTNEKEYWCNYSYKDDIIKHLTHTQDSITDSIIKTYISDYLSILKSEIMGIQGKAQELANAIYENHKQIIDFVVDFRDANKEYKQFWEKEREWVFKFADEFIKWINEADSANEYVLGYVKNAITVKQKTKGQNRYYNIYLIYQGKKGKKDDVNIDFVFSAKELQENKKESVKEILDNKKQVDYTDNPAYFTIFSVGNFKDELIEIHKKRFELP